MSAASAPKEYFLFVFILDLRNAYFRAMIFRLGEVRTIRHECFPNDLRITFTQLKNDSMKSPLRIKIFDC